MSLLLPISIFIFSFFLSKINRKKIVIPIFISISIIFTPLFIFNKVETQTLIFFIPSLLLLIVTDLSKNKILKKILFLVTLIYFSLSILYLTGLINNKMEIDNQRLFIVDNFSLETIKRFQQNALYLPKIFRPIIYNPFQLIFITFVRILNYLWIDKVITYLGFSLIYLIYLSLLVKKNIHYLIIPLVVILTAILHRDPNNHLIYLFSLPPLILIFIKNIKKINIFLLLVLILISCLYSFL
jgi:hypothetical protein